MSTPPRITRILIISSLALAFVASLPGQSLLQTAKPVEQIVPQDTIITLERTACYGTCPIYKLTISGNGAVIFEGKRFVKKVGTSRFVIPEAQVRELVDAFEKINYFDLKDQYVKPEDGCRQRETDNPSAVTSLMLRGKSKSVTHYHGCIGPEVLRQLEKLEQAIDNAANSAQWIR